MADLKTLPYGFQWGPMVVERAASDPKWGVVLHIRTGRQLVTVRATPSGLLRVSTIETDFLTERQSA